MFIKEYINFFNQKLFKLKRAFKIMKMIYSILVSIFMVVSGQTLLKEGLERISLNLSEILSIVNIFYEPLILMGLVLTGLSSIVWLSILSKAEISYAYPFVSLGYVIVALISLFYFNEYVSPIRWVGIFTICFGVFLMSKS